MKIIRKLRHILLFIVLFGSDLVIGFFGHYQGSGGGDFIEYISELSFSDIGPTLVVAVTVIVFVEFLWRHK